MQKISIRLLLRAVALVCLSSLFTVVMRGEDLSVTARKAIEKSTLDQSGTKPFHLKATFAPSLERDKDSHRTGEVEIWWESPTRWRREVSCPEFQQIAIVDGTQQWQKNTGEYFPEWLRELVIAIIRPMPIPMDVLQQRVKTAEVREIKFPSRTQAIPIEQTNINWNAVTQFGDAQSNGKGYLALINGKLSYAGGPGFGGSYRDFKDFHGREVAFAISSGTPEVTAKIVVLEDLGPTPGDFFATNAPGGAAQLIQTAVLDEAELRKSMIESKPFAWPPVTDGPLEGGAGTVVVVDRTGKVREMRKPISDNPAMVEAAEQGFQAITFQPIVRSGVAVQAVAPLTTTFKTVRPAGAESFDSVRSYFERGRKLSCIGSGATAPYLLKAEFQVGGSGGIETGRYEDTWINATEWKREAWVGSSHLLRSQVGDKHYVLAEGPEAGILRLVMLSVEPIPATDTMTESDWRITRDSVHGVKAIRIFRGPEGANGELDPKSSQGYWFSDDGQLLKSYVTGFEIMPTNVQPYGGVQVAREIALMRDGKVGMKLNVKEINSADPATAKTFAIKGHEWQRSFTAEVR